LSIILNIAKRNQETSIPKFPMNNPRKIDKLHKISIIFKFIGRI